jgi:hypothetical protein
VTGIRRSPLFARLTEAPAIAPWAMAWSLDIFLEWRSQNTRLVCNYLNRPLL